MLENSAHLGGAPSPTDVNPPVPYNACEKVRFLVLLSPDMRTPFTYKYYNDQTGSAGKKIWVHRFRDDVQNPCAGIKGDPNAFLLRYRDDRHAILGTSKK